MDDGRDTTFAYDKSTSVTGLPCRCVAERQGTQYPIPDTYIRSPSDTGISETVTGPLKRSPPLDAVEQLPKEDSPKPHPQIESSSTDGSDKHADHRPSQQVWRERPPKLFSYQSRKEKYELVRETGETSDGVDKGELVRFTNFVVCRDWVPCRISLGSRAYHLMRDPYGYLFYEPIE